MKQQTKSGEEIAARSLVLLVKKRFVSAEQVHDVLASKIQEGYSLFEACALAHKELLCEHRATPAFTRMRRSLRSPKERAFLDRLAPVKQRVLSHA